LGFFNKTLRKTETGVSLKMIFLKPVETVIVSSFDLENKILVIDGQGKNMDVATVFLIKASSLLYHFLLWDFPKNMKILSLRYR
jgi:hypothetical protein